MLLRLFLCISFEQYVAIRFTIFCSVVSSEMIALPKISHTLLKKIKLCVTVNRFLKQFNIPPKWILSIIYAIEICSRKISAHEKLLPAIKLYNLTVKEKKDFNILSLKYKATTLTLKCVGSMAIGVFYVSYCWRSNSDMRIFQYSLKLVLIWTEFTTGR